MVSFGIHKILSKVYKGTITTWDQGPRATNIRRFFSHRGFGFLIVIGLCIKSLA